MVRAVRSIGAARTAVPCGDLPVSQMVRQKSLVCLPPNTVAESAWFTQRGQPAEVTHIRTDLLPEHVREPVLKKPLLSHRGPDCDEVAQGDLVYIP